MQKIMLWSGAALATLVAVPLIAQAPAGSGMGMGPDRIVKRAEVEPMVKMMFSRIDANTDGAITKDEIAAAREKRKAERKGRMFDALDTNKDGSISRAEFMADHGPMGRPDGPPPPPPGAGPDGMTHGPKGPMGKGHMGMGPMGMGKGGMADAMFNRADANKDGKVTMAEATTAALAHFDEVDTNHDGQVTGEERRAFHQKMHGGK